MNNKPLIELLRPRSDRVMKMESVRGILYKGSYSPITRVVHAEVKGKITPRAYHMLESSKAVQFPQWTGSNVLGEKVNLPLPEPLDTQKPVFVGLCFRNFGFECLNQWFDGLEKRKVEDLFAIYVAEGNPIYKIVTKWIAWRNLAKTFNERQKKQFVLYDKDFYDEAYELKVDNILTSHLFLLDHEGKVRWSATGFPSCEEEIDDAVKFFEKLKKEKNTKIKQLGVLDKESIDAAQAALKNNKQ